MKKAFLSILLLVSSAVLPMSFHAEEIAPVRCTVEVSGQGKGRLTIENNTENAYTFKVYSITGQLVYSVTLKSGKDAVVLPKGFYIVKSELGSQKVVVR